MLSFLEALGQGGRGFGILVAFLGVLLIAATIAERFALKIKLQGSLLIFVAGLLININYDEQLVEQVEHLHQLGLALLLFYAGLMFCEPFSQSRRVVRSQLVLVVLVTLLSLSLSVGLLYGVLTSPLSLFGAVQHPFVFALLLTYACTVMDWGAFWYLSKRIANLSSWVQTTFQFEASLGTSIIIIWGNSNLRYFERALPQASHLTTHTYPWGALPLTAGVGIVLAHCLYLLITHLSLEKPQVFVITIGTVILGYGITHGLLGLGGAMTSLCMGAYLGVKLKNAMAATDLPGENETSMQTISLQIESINIGTEAILTFLVGLTIKSNQLILTIPAGISLALVIWVSRPLAAMAAYSFSKWVSRIRILSLTALDSISRHDLFVWSMCSPKGIIGIAIACTFPQALRQSGIPMEEFFGIPEYVGVDSVCIAVLFTMIMQNLIFPRLFRQPHVEAR